MIVFEMSTQFGKEIDVSFIFKGTLSGTSFIIALTHETSGGSVGVFVSCFRSDALGCELCYSQLRETISDNCFFY